MLKLRDIENCKLKFKNDNGVWQWNGRIKTAMNYTRWGGSDPNENSPCATIYSSTNSDYRFGDKPCSATRACICETDIA